MEFIYKYEFIIIVETHVTENEYDKFENYFTNYRIAWIGAKKVSNFGRASGGILVGCRRDLSCNFVRTEGSGLVFAEVEFGGKSFSIFPMYLNQKSWYADFFGIADSLQSILDRNIVLIGDANVRIGAIQNLPEELVEGVPALVSSHRNSKDSVVNCVGRTFVDSCNELGLILMNGRSISDELGEFTYMGACGSSVNDICCASVNMVDELVDFEVLSESYSDHMPIILTIKNGCPPEGGEVLSLLTRLMWSDARKNDYNVNLRSLLQEYPHYADIEAKEKLLTYINYFFH